MPLTLIGIIEILNLQQRYTHIWHTYYVKWNESVAIKTTKQHIVENLFQIYS